MYSEVYTVADLWATDQKPYLFLFRSAFNASSLPRWPLCVSRLVSTGRARDQMGGKRAIMAVGQLIRTLRKNGKASQTELACRIGIAFQEVRKYENSTRRVCAGGLMHIAKALDVPIVAFFEGLAPLTKGQSDAATLMTEPQAHRLLE